MSLEQEIDGIVVEAADLRRRFHVSDSAAPGFLHRMTSACATVGGAWILVLIGRWSVEDPRLPPMAWATKYADEQSVLLSRLAMYPDPSQKTRVDAAARYVDRVLPARLVRARLAREFMASILGALIGSMIQSASGVIVIVMLAYKPVPQGISACAALVAFGCACAIYRCGLIDFAQALVRRPG